MRLFSQDTKVNALKRAPLFQDLSRKELGHLARVSEDLEIPTGTALCKEGEIGREFFVIVEGKVEVTRGGKRVAMRGGGEFVGEIALLEQTPRTATVTAKTPLRVFVLTDKGLPRPRQGEHCGRAEGAASAGAAGRRAVARPDGGLRGLMCHRPS
jgi:CRP/FNR family transcriptional regulator, cyclic AMP receptor protein